MSILVWSWSGSSTSQCAERDVFWRSDTGVQGVQGKSVTFLSCCPSLFAQPHAAAPRFFLFKLAVRSAPYCPVCLSDLSVLDILLFSSLLSFLSVCNIFILHRILGNPVNIKSLPLLVTMPRRLGH